MNILFLYVPVTVHREQSVKKEFQQIQQYRWFIVNCRCWLLTTVSTYFGYLYAHHQEKRPHVTAYGVYLLVVLDVAGCSTVVLCWVCDHCEGCCRVWSLWRLLFEQQTSQCSQPQCRTTVPQPATSSATSKYTPYAVTRGLFSRWWA